MSINYFGTAHFIIDPVSLQDLISGLNLPWSSLMKDEESKIETNTSVEKESEKEDEARDIDSLLEGKEEENVGVAEQPAAPDKKREWAIKVDLKENIDDFHQRVPHMAHKV